MSGDAGLNETIVFYSSKMTETKAVLLKHKGIHLNYKSLEISTFNDANTKRGK